MLNSETEAPQLPHGYIVSLYACTIPKVWFDMMDPLVDEYQQTSGIKLAESAVYARALAKTKVFVKWAFLVTLALALFEFAWKFSF